MRFLIQLVKQRQEKPMMESVDQRLGEPDPKQRQVKEEVSG